MPSFDSAITPVLSYQRYREDHKKHQEPQHLSNKTKPRCFLMFLLPLYSTFLEVFVNKIAGTVENETLSQSPAVEKEKTEMTHQPFTAVLLGSVAQQCRGWAPNQALQLCKMKIVGLERGHSAFFMQKNINAESGPCHNSRACLNMCCSRHGNIDYWKIIDRFTLISPFLSHKSHNSMSGHTKICRNRRLKKPMSWQCFAKHLCSRKHSALDLCESVCESAFFKLPSVQAWSSMYPVRTLSKHVKTPDSPKWYPLAAAPGWREWRCLARPSWKGIWWNSNGHLWIEHPWRNWTKRVAMIRLWVAFHFSFESHGQTLWTAKLSTLRLFLT